MTIRPNMKSITNMSEKNILTNKKNTNTRPWYVLTTNNPKNVKEQFEQWNIEMEAGNKQERSIDYFIPCTFIDSNIFKASAMPDKLSIRSALYHYLFVQGEFEDISALIYKVNSSSNNRMFFLKKKSNTKATITQSDMDKIVFLCSKDEYSFNLPLFAEDLQEGKMITLTNTPFEKNKAIYKIVNVIPKKNGTYRVQVELNLFNVKFKSLFVTLYDIPNDAQFCEIVGNSQKKIIDIFSRMVNDKQTEFTKSKDQKSLRAIFKNRSISFPPGAMRRHFLALMLICAHLLGDVQEKAKQKELVEKELNEIAKLRESKAATDTRAYLHIAMYIATKEAKYREKAKAYVREHNPSSPYLRKLINTSAKREALKILGDKII